MESGTDFLKGKFDTFQPMTFKIINLTLLRHLFCTSSSQLLVPVACRKKATRSTFSPTRFRVTWIQRVTWILLSIFPPHCYFPELFPVLPNALTMYTVFLSHSLALSPPRPAPSPALSNPSVGLCHSGQREDPTAHPTCSSAPPLR